MKALAMETISDSNDLADIEGTFSLNEDIRVRVFRGGVIDIYNYTEDTGVVLRPEEAYMLRLFLEGVIR